MYSGSSFLQLIPGWYLPTRLFLCTLYRQPKCVKILEPWYKPGKNDCYSNYNLYTFVFNNILLLIKPVLFFIILMMNFCRLFL